MRCDIGVAGKRPPAFEHVRIDVNAFEDKIAHALLLQCDGKSHLGIAIARPDADEARRTLRAGVKCARQIKDEELVGIGEAERLLHLAQIFVRPVMENRRQIVDVDLCGENRLLLRDLGCVVRVRFLRMPWR